MIKQILYIGLIAAFSVTVCATELPERGRLKKDIRSQFGQPDEIQGPVGKPPITRWIYEDFTVVFEYNHVIHAFVRQVELERRPTSSIAPRPEPSQGDILNIPE